MKALPFVDYGFRLRSVAEIQTLAEAAGLTLSDHQHIGSGSRAGHLLVMVRTDGVATA
jgi:hypothetical protein